MQIGDALRQARLKKGLRQSDVAAALPHSVHPKTVGKWERGLALPRGQVPHLERLLGLRLTGDEPSTPAPSDLSVMSDTELMGEIMRLFGEMARRLPGTADPTSPIDAATVLEHGWSVTRRNEPGLNGGTDAVAQ
ncbi:MAG: helix-turn-helix domain-containing protein [Pseudonocardia sp.]|nr:helix-turn-helix domain-containing protein [Pseudonocardia sp.]